MFRTECYNCIVKVMKMVVLNAFSPVEMPLSRPAIKREKK